jgi:hypothetical protein
MVSFEKDFSEFVYIYVYIYIYIHTYIYTHTRTHTHTYNIYVGLFSICASSRGDGAERCHTRDAGPGALTE